MNYRDRYYNTMVPAWTTVNVITVIPACTTVTVTTIQWSLHVLPWTLLQNNGPCMYYRFTMVKCTTWMLGWLMIVARFWIWALALCITGPSWIARGLLNCAALPRARCFILHRKYTRDFKAEWELILTCKNTFIYFSAPVGFFKQSRS
jgi:hypothetical protein